MLSFCISDDKWHTGDVRCQFNEPFEPESALPMRDRYQAYMTENALLYCVREGDLN